MVLTINYQAITERKGGIKFNLARINPRGVVAINSDIASIRYQITDDM